MLDFNERILEARTLARGGERLRKLNEADAALQRLRIYLRLAHEWHWLSAGQYRHAGEMVTRIGQLLGGWIRASQKSEAPRSR